MKTPENQKSTAHQPATQKPFFGAASDRPFFSPERTATSPFFQAKAASSSTVQAKSATNEAESNDPSLVQRIPAFESEVPANESVQRSSLHLQPSSALPIQAKLTVGQVGDQYEQEADRVAAQVVEQINAPTSATGEGQAVQRMGQEEEDLQMQRSPLAIQRVEQAEEDLQMMPMEKSIQRMGEEDEELQMKPTVQRVGAEGGAVSADLEGEINAARSGGQNLAPNLQAQMGQVMGADFSGVRVHTDARADQLNRAVNSRAFTTKQDLFFKQGEYQPGSRGGQELIAHELTHVVQQNGGAVQPTSNSPQILLKNENTAIQRLLGFEFETNFPASHLGGALDAGGKLNETAQETTLRQFLTGQAYADDAIHNFPGDDFEAVADHGPVSSAIEGARESINYEMFKAVPPIGTAKQYIGGADPRDPIHPKPGIVEYKTAAFDTSTLGGITDFSTAISDLATHLHDTYSQIIGSGRANPPLSSPAWLVGVPSPTAWVALGNRYNIPASTMISQRQKITKEINPQIYPQITVGVLPKNIPTLFEETHKAGLTQGQDPKLRRVSEAASQLRVTHAEAVARKALADCAGMPNVVIDNDTIGYVTLIAQYVFGSFADAVEHFDISKNLPIFLSKTHLTGAQRTIGNVNARPASWDASIADAAPTIDRLVSKLWKYGADAFNKTKPQTRVDRNTEGAFTKANAWNILANDHGDDPFLTAVSHRTLGLDPHSDRLGNVTADQEIPLEFRALEDIRDPGQLEKWSEKALSLIQYVNPVE